MVERKWSKQLGVMFMLIALLLNPFLLGLIFSPDNKISTPSTIIGILLFEMIVFVFGLGLYYWDMLLKYQFMSRIMILIVSGIFCLAAIEISILILGEYDLDGQFSFGGRDLMPYKLPVNALKGHINDFENLTNPHAIPDPQLGWTIANNSNSLRPLGYYQSNSIGVRSDREFNLTKNEGTLRIAMFGDSFIHSYDVPMNGTLAFHIEKELSLMTPAITAEVMNFGVGAYGIDQAYLRWKLQGAKYNPDVIIMGFQAENCKRNANVIRKLYFRETEIPFSKPRFILVNKSLMLVNYSPVPYQNVPDIVKNFASSPLAKYEYYYHSEDYNDNNPLFYSKLVRYLYTSIREHEEKKNDYMNYETGSEVAELCYTILQNFYNEASLNATVYMLHLPTEQDLLGKVSTPQKDFVYTQLLSRLKKDFKVIDPTVDLVNEAKNSTFESLFVGHYSSKTNEIVARNIIKTLQRDNPSELWKGE